MRLIYTALALACLAGCTTHAERPPSFIVLLCDNLGYGDTEPFGSTLNSLAKTLPISSRRYSSHD